MTEIVAGLVKSRSKESGSPPLTKEAKMAANSFKGTGSGKEKKPHRCPLSKTCDRQETKMKSDLSSTITHALMASAPLICRKVRKRVRALAVPHHITPLQRACLTWSHSAMRDPQWGRGQGRGRGWRGRSVMTADVLCDDGEPRTATGGHVDGRGKKPSRRDCEAAPLTNCTVRLSYCRPASREHPPHPFDSLSLTSGEMILTMVEVKVAENCAKPKKCN